MKCYTHTAADAVGQCSGCQVGLCKECVGNYTNRVCSECFIKAKGWLVKSIYKDIAFMLVGATVFLAIPYFLLYDPTLPGGNFGLFFWWGVMGAFFYPSWMFVSRFFTMQFTETASQMTYLMVKFLIAAILGVILGPIGLLLKIVYLIKAKKQMKLATQLAAIQNNQA